MSSNGKGDRLREYFDQLRREDQMCAPSLAATLTAAERRAGMKAKRTRRLTFVLPVGLIVAALVALLLLSSLRTPIQPDDAMVEGAQPEVAPMIRNADTLRPSLLLATIRRSDKRSRQSRSRPAEMQAAVAIFAWRSPTESLLRSPGEEVLSSVPRLNESTRALESMLFNDLK